MGTWSKVSAVWRKCYCPGIHCKNSTIRHLYKEATWQDLCNTSWFISSSKVKGITVFRVIILSFISKCAWGKFCQLLPLSPTAICPFWPEVRCTHHVWRVWWCMQQRLGPWRWIHWTVSGVMTVPWSVGSAMSGQRTKLAQTPFSQSLASRT